MNSIIEAETRPTRRLAGLFFVGGFMGLGATLQLLLNIQIGNSYGADQAGRFYLGLTIMTIVAMIARLGYDNAVIRFAAPSIKRGAVSETASLHGRMQLTVLLASGISALVLFLVSDLVANSIFSDSELKEYLQIFALCVPPFSLMWLNAEFIRASKKTTLSVFMRYIALYAIACLGIVTLDANSSALDASKVFLASSVLAWIFSEIYLTYEINSPLSRRLQFDLNATRKLLKISLPLLAASFSIFIMGWTDTIMLGLLESSSDVGIYTAALRIAMVLTLVLTTINQYVTPHISTLFEENKKKQMEKLFHQVTIYGVIIALPLFIAISLSSEFILGLFGGEFKTGSIALVVLAAGQFANVLAGPVGNLLAITGYERIFARTTIAVALLNTMLNLILINAYGINGAAIATAISVIAYNTFLSLIATHYLGFSSLTIWRRS